MLFLSNNKSRGCVMNDDEFNDEMSLKYDERIDLFIRDNERRFNYIVYEKEEKLDKLMDKI